MGREREQAIVRLFQAVAATVGEAEGELRCEIDDDQVDPHFEFFTINGGRLLRQRGSLMREVERVPVE